MNRSLSGSYVRKLKRDDPRHPLFHVWRKIYIVLRIKCVLFIYSFKAYRFEQEYEQNNSTAVQTEEIINSTGQSHLSPSRKILSTIHSITYRSGSRHPIPGRKASPAPVPSFLSGPHCPYKPVHRHRTIRKSAHVR